MYKGNHIYGTDAYNHDFIYVDACQCIAYMNADDIFKERLRAVQFVYCLESYVDQTIIPLFNTDKEREKVWDLFYLFFKKTRRICITDDEKENIIMLLERLNCDIKDIIGEERMRLLMQHSFERFDYYFDRALSNNQFSS